MLCTKIHRISTLCFMYTRRYVSGARQLRTTGLRSLSSASPAHVDQADAGEEGIQSQSGKPRHNVPFAKNLFLGKIEQAMLVFPEALEEEQLEDLNHMIQPIEKFFAESVDSVAIDANKQIPEETLEQLKKFGLFGQRIPKEYGGLGLGATESARIAEVTATDYSVAVMLAAHHNAGLKGIQLCGTDTQKAQYLPKLASGKHVAAFCLTELASGSDAAYIETKAVPSEDGKTYKLTGSKIWVSNGSTADIFTVFAKIPYKNTMGDVEETVTAFIVERSFGGITNGNRQETMGICGSDTCEVNFDNTPVPAENILGGVGGGFRVAMRVLNSGRYTMGSAGAGILKRLLELSAKHAIHREQFGQKLTEFGMIQEKFARVALDVYAMESMTYMTAAILDRYEEPDVSVESAIVKVFSSEKTWHGVSDCLQVLGGWGYTKNTPIERYLRDSRIMMISEGTNEVLRLYIAINCLQFAGSGIREMVKKMRDPFNNLGFLFKKTIERRKMARKKPHFALKLYDHVHPEFGFAAEELEKNLCNFQMVVEKFLSMCTEGIAGEQMALRRLADIAIDFYACTCVVARASRSMSIGLKNADHEALMARTFCLQALARIEKNIEDLDITKYNNGDEMLRMVAETIFKNGGYAAEHPLMRNW